MAFLIKHSSRCQLPAAARARPAAVRRVVLARASDEEAAPEPAQAAATVDVPATDVPAVTTRKTYTLTGPEPSTFMPAEGTLTDIATASPPAIIRGGSGLFCIGYEVKLVPDDDPAKYAVTRINDQRVQETCTIEGLPRPAQPLELYEYEACPFCKKVREAVTMLDLDVMVYPTPQDGVTWRPKAIELGGQKQFPFLVDPNTGTQMYESDEIIKYLFNTYGPGESAIPAPLTAGTLTTLACAMGAIGRGGRGNKYQPSNLPAEPLVFWGYEASPFVKVAREVLCELELPYMHVATGRGSSKRQLMQDLYGKFQAPFLEDPNTGVAMYESKAIIEYLRNTYGA